MSDHETSLPGRTQADAGQPPSTPRTAPTGTSTGASTPPAGQGTHGQTAHTETDETAPLIEREARAYREARRRLRTLHASLAGRRQDWANNTENPCSTARAVSYQSAMSSIHSILDEIEAIAEGKR